MMAAHQVAIEREALARIIAREMAKCEDVPTCIAPYVAESRRIDKTVAA